MTFLFIESGVQVLILSAINEISIVNNKKSYESVDIPQNIWAFERIMELGAGPRQLSRVSGLPYSIVYKLKKL